MEMVAKQKERSLVLMIDSLKYLNQAIQAIQIHQFTYRVFIRQPSERQHQKSSKNYSQTILNFKIFGKFIMLRQLTILLLTLLLLKPTLTLKKVDSHFTSQPQTQTQQHLGGSFFSSLGNKIAAGVAGIGGAVSATAATVTGAGFTGSGVAAGSVAAAIQSGIGNVAAGSAFAGAQSLAATGVIGTLGIVGGVVVVGGLGYLGYRYISAMNSKP